MKSRFFVHAAMVGCLATFTSTAIPAPAPLSLLNAGGGVLSAPAAHADFLYMGNGSILSTWRLTDPAHPIIVDREIETPARGTIRGVAKVDEYLFVLWGNTSTDGGIDIYSIAEPVNPIKVSEFNDYSGSPSRTPTGILASGNHLYIGDAEGGTMSVLDVTQPMRPVRSSTFHGGDGIETMRIIGSRLYATGDSILLGQALSIINIENPDAPKLIGSTLLDSRIHRTIVIDGFAVSVGNELVVHDLRDPADIREVFNVEIDQARDAMQVGDLVYLFGATGVQVWDFSEPTLPIPIRTIAISAKEVAQVATTPFGPLILTNLDHGLLLNVEDPLNPSLRSRFDLPFGVAASAAAFDESNVYISQWYYGFSAMNKSTLEQVGRFDAAPLADNFSPDVEDIFVSNGMAYLAAWAEGVVIADLSDPSSPKEAGRFGFRFATALEVVGDVLYVGSSTNGGILKTIDVSDPSSPTELGSISTIKIKDLTVRGTFVYLGDEASGLGAGDGGLRIVDVTDPRAPRVVGQEAGCDYAMGIDVSADGDTSYVACALNAASRGELRIVDTSKKTHPRHIASVEIPGTAQFPDASSAYSVVVAGGIAYIGHENGVDEIDVRNPAKPVWLQRHSVPNAVRKLSLAPGGKLFGFAGDMGAHIFAVDPVFTDGFD